MVAALNSAASAPAAPGSDATIAIVGGGPAGLMAAEVLAGAGERVALFDAMPSLGRKFLMAGKGGLNITHTEPLAGFIGRYGARAREIAPLLEAFGPQAVRDWMHGLGVASFVGSSGRVFPEGMKAAPLLRAWLHRLRTQGVAIHARHRWTGWTPRPDGGAVLRFSTPQGEQARSFDTVVLALGGASWPQLGADGLWVDALAAAAVPVAPLRPANCGFDVGWSDFFRTHCAGQPVKNIVAACVAENGERHARPGDLTITASGVEGGPIYALSAWLREAIATHGAATLEIDLLPGRDAAAVLAETARPRGARSLASHLQGRLGIRDAKAKLLRECLPAATFADPVRLAAALKALPLRLCAPRPLAEAISTAGGVCFEALDATLMLRALPGVFCAGEMLDWEAPTGGYLLTACLASGRAAGHGALAWHRRAPEAVA